MYIRAYTCSHIRIQVGQRQPNLNAKLGRANAKRQHVALWAALAIQPRLDALPRAWL
jgi:hypothetical protein